MSRRCFSEKAFDSANQQDFAYDVEETGADIILFHEFFRIVRKNFSMELPDEFDGKNRLSRS